MLGQPASWQTVCSPSRFTRSATAAYSGPVLSLIFSHSGLRSIGVSALRASTRSRRRAPGSTTDRLRGGRQCVRQRRLDAVDDVVGGDAGAGEDGQRGDAGVADAAGHDAVVRREVGVAVEREAVHRDALRDPDADRGDLRVLDPDAAAALDPAGRDAVRVAHVDERLLDPAYVTDDVDRVGQPGDWVADELSGAVPGDLAAAVDVDHRSAVGRSLP